MHIPPLHCDACGRNGRPGEEGFQLSASGAVVTVHCTCGNVINIDSSFDQCILSTNAFVRLSEASNQRDQGQLSVAPGIAIQVTFTKPFDHLCRAFFTPVGHPLIVKEVFVSNTGMTVVSSSWGDPRPDNVQVNWLVFGLVDVDNLPPWYVQFYGGITQLQNGLYKAALLEYAAAFEIYLEAILRSLLAGRYGMPVSEYLLKNAWRVEDRCKDMLELAVGRRLTDRPDLYQPWDQFVKSPRNDLVHGKNLHITADAAEKAHQAVFQVIRWIDSLVATA